MRTVNIPHTNEKIPIIGQGTWGIKSNKKREYYDDLKKTLRTGIALGMTHIDTAEFYGFGTSEKIVGEIIAEYDKNDLFITSKVFPMHFSMKAMKKAANKSLKRLGINQFDLYLIHWPSPITSIKKQMELFESLIKEEKSRYFGVSNFSVEQFTKAQDFLKNTQLINNQIPANITRQEHIEKSLSHYQSNGIIMTAYSPLAHRGYTKLKGDLRDKLEDVAKNHNATIQQIAIAWLVNHENVITIPKAFNIDHVEANAKAADIKLTRDEVKLFYENPPIIENINLVDFGV